MSRRRKQQRADEQPGTRPAVSFPIIVSHEHPAGAELARAFGVEFEPDGRGEPHPLAARDIEDVVNDPAATVDDVSAWYRARRDPDLQAVVDGVQEGGKPALPTPDWEPPPGVEYGAVVPLFSAAELLAEVDAIAATEPPPIAGVFLPGSWDEVAALAPEPELGKTPDVAELVPSDTRFTAIFGACADVAGKRGLGAAAARLHEAQLALDEFRAKLPAAIAAMRALGMPGEFVADLERMAAVL